MARTEDLAKDLLFNTFKILKKNDGELSMDNLINELQNSMDFDKWAQEPLKKTGYIRWHSILQFYSIDCVKSGFLIKKKGIWYLTPEGEKALQKGKEGLFQSAHEGYLKWKAESQQKCLTDDNSEEKIEQEVSSNASLIENADSNSNLSFSKFILNNFEAYSFQRLCAALFRGMGYYTPFIAPKGKDGGVDIIAYKDPIGSSAPHIKVQVKYRKDTKATSQEIRALKGSLNSKNDVGVFISIADFTPDAKKESRQSTDKHVELIDLERFIELWQEFYDKMTDEDKSLMPIRAVYFVSK